MKRSLPTLLSRGRVVLGFFSAQGLTMVANLLYGLLCVRLLVSEEYAKYVVVFGIMGTLLILMDANFTGALMPLVGARVDDKPLIANYVASLRRLSGWAYVAVGLGTIFFFPFMVRNRGWSNATIVEMIVCILICTWCSRLASNYFPVLMMQRDRTTWYKAQMVSSVGTLMLLMVLWKLRLASALAAIGLNLLGYAYVGMMTFRRSRELLGGTGRPEPEKQRAIVRLALPNMPQAFFFAVQGQISLFLIAYFGHTKGVASVGALGRLGQIFSIFLQANSLLVEPYFAKLPEDKLRSHYLIALGTGVAIALGIVGVTAEWPHMLLWALGPQYSDLTFEVKLAVTSGAINFVAGLLWGMHSARRFVFWWNVVFGIGLTLITQVVFIVKMDVSSVRSVLWLNFATSCALLVVNGSAGLWGFWKGPRKAEKPVAITEGEAEAERILAMQELENQKMPSTPPNRVVQPEIINDEV